jgi:hypothetical protein
VGRWAVIGDGCSSTKILPLPRDNQPCYFLTKKVNESSEHLQIVDAKLEKLKLEILPAEKFKLGKKAIFEVTKSSKLGSPI